MDAKCRIDVGFTIGEIFSIPKYILHAGLMHIDPIVIAHLSLSLFMVVHGHQDPNLSILLWQTRYENLDVL